MDAQSISPEAQPLTQPDVGSHTGVAPMHRVPQVRQSVAVDRSVSHPSLGSELQSSNPASQLAIAHVPVAHDSIARGSEHAPPQLPQSLIVRREVSQPVSAAPSQSPYSASHAPTSQVPVAQLSVAFASEHAMPQPPQSVRLSVNTSHPVSGFPSQSA